MDHPATVHQVNVLTVVASESYKDFVKALQTDMSESLSARPRTADEAYFTDKVLKTPAGDIEVTKEMARALHRYLIKNDFADDKDQITQAYHDAKAAGTLPALPPELAPHAEQVFALVATVFTEGQIPLPEDDRKAKTNNLNANFHKAEFQALWNKINRKAVYTVHFDSAELIKKAVAALDKELRVTRLHYTIQRGEQKATGDFDELQKSESFTLEEHETKPLDVSVQSTVKYDLIGKLAEDTKLTRRTIAQILTGMNLAVFNQYKVNPEDFMIQAARLINEQKATVIVEHLAYNPLEESHTTEIFTREKPRDDFSKAYEAKRHVYDYVFTDSKNERTFVEELDTSTEVVVYAKLPRSFFIPTPVGDYNPDWAIAFQEGAVKHVYFIAETKGTMSSMELRKIEESKIECARKFFAKITSTQVKYEVVESYAKLLELVR
jgi:type III restriction enzyme